MIIAKIKSQLSIPLGLVETVERSDGLLFVTQLQCAYVQVYLRAAL